MSHNKLSFVTFGKANSGATLKERGKGKKEEEQMSTKKY
tara:strand:- start:4120 stop:4236 length:117 start_codon:yes stop_codon:yes gene_type:complete